MENICISRDENAIKRVGEKATKSRTEIAIRNTNIFKDYKSGICIKVLTSKYYLSEKSIQRIISQIKKKE